MGFTKRQWLNKYFVVVVLACPSTGLGIEISAVSISSESFAPARGQSVEIGYILDSPGMVSIDVYDPDFCLVRELAKNSPKAAGRHTQTWDGRDLADSIVPDEAYFFTIVARDSTGQESVYDPTTFSGGDEFDITTVQIDNTANTITYRLDQPSRILIRIGISGGPLLNSLVSWRPRVSGEITEYWNGRDQDGLMDLLDDSRFKMIITGFRLVENSTITYGNSAENYFGYKSRLGAQRPKKPARAAIAREGVRISPHYLRPRIFDKPVNVILSFPQNGSADSAILTITAPQELVRVELAQEDVPHFIDEPFEVSFFLDGDYYSEEEIGFTPYNWPWNVSDVPAGEHLLTVNLSSFKDIIGIKSRKILIEK